MFGFGKLFKRRNLSAIEEAELRRWSFNKAQEYRMYSQSFMEQHKAPANPDIYLKETLELADMLTEWMISGHFQFEKLQNHNSL